MFHTSLKLDKTVKQRGFTLLASLLILLLLSALSISLVYMITTERSIGSSDRDYSIAYYAAEAGMEKMINDLGTLYTQTSVPTVANITALAGTAYQPSFNNVVYLEYIFNVPNVGGVPTYQIRNVSTGPDAGLIAQIIPTTLQVTAQRTPTGSQSRLLRSVEVALIPVFQFGAFSDGDLDFFAGPNFSFAGRIHTNGSLYLTSGGTATGGVTLTLHAQITAVGDIVRNDLENGVPVGSGAGANARNGNVAIPTATNGCDGAAPACRNMAQTEGSVVGLPAPASAATAGWTNISLTTYAGFVENGLTGAKKLVLPFVQPGVTAIEILKPPLAGEDPASAIGQSRIYNQAQIRVLLADNPANLPGGAGDSQNV